MEIIELEHQSGKLGISIEGGIGSEYYKGFVYNFLDLQLMKIFQRS